MTESYGGATDEKVHRRRPGRLRRWVLRPLLWVLALLALLSLAAAAFLRSDLFRQRARTLLVARASEFLGRQIEVGDLSLRLLPLGLELEGVVIPGPAPGDPPLARIGRVLLEADLEGLRSPVLHLRTIRIDEPEMYLEFRQDGEDNLPDLPEGRGGGERRLEVMIGSLTVERGTLELAERRLPLELSARAVQAHFLGTGGLSFQGRLAAQEVEVALPKARPYAAAVSLKATYGEGRIDLVAGRVSGPELAADLRGRFSWKEEREIDLRVAAEAEAALLERLGYLAEGVDGTVRFDGGFGWQPGSWGYRGNLSSPRLVLAGRQLTGVAGVLAGDANGLRFDLAKAVYGGGSVRGTVAVDTDAPGRPVSVDLTLDGVDLEPLLADQGIPLQGLGGRATGVVSYRFLPADPQGGEGWAEVGIAAAAVGPGRLPTSGTIPLGIEGGVVRTEAARLTAGSQRLLAGGSYDLASDEGRFDFTLTSPRLEELGLLLPPGEAGEPPPPWLPTGGEGAFAGSLWLSPQAAAARIELDLEGVAAPGARADRVTGSLRIDRQGIEGLHLELSRPGGALMVTGDVPFPQEEGPPAPRRLELAVDAVSWPLDDARPWVPFALPFDGDFTGAVRLAGPLEEPWGEVAGEVAPVRVAEMELQSLRAELTFDPREAVVREAVLAAAAGEVVASGVLLRQEERLSFALRGTGLDLAASPFSDLVAGDLGGRLAVDATLEGSLGEPALTARLEASELTLGSHPLGRQGGAALELRWRGGEVAAEGSLLGLVTLAGGGRMDGERVDLTVSLESSHLGALVELVTEGPAPEVAGSLAGELRMTGEPTAGGLAVRAELSRLVASYGGHSLSNLEPVVVRLEGEALVIESLFLGQEEGPSELFVAGRVGLEEEHRLDLRVQSSLEASWFELAIPGIEAEGTFDVLATVRGTAAEPAVNGQGEVRDGRLIVPGIPQSFEDLRGIVLFYPRQVVIDRLEAGFANGSVRLTGTVRPFAQDPAAVYRLQASARRLNLRYPEGWLLRGGGELVLAPTEEGRQLRGTVDLERAYYVRDVQLGAVQLLQRFFQRRRLEVEPTEEALAETQLNLVVRGPGALRIRNNLANLRGDIDLVVRGSLARPVAFGSVELEPGGTLLYAGNEYRIQRGELNFTNPYRLEPLVDLVATAKVREFDVTLSVSGPPDRLEASFASEPPLPDLEVLALLTTGGPLAGGGEIGRGGAGDGAAESFLFGQAASAISERFNVLFGLDKFRIDPLTGSSGDLSSARVTVGKRLSRDFFATYSYDPSQTEEQILQLEWQVNPGLAFILTQNGDGTFALDARWERAF